MDEILKLRFEDIPRKYKHEHDGYEYHKRELVPKGHTQQCAISVYEIPPENRNLGQGY